MAVPLSVRFFSDDTGQCAHWGSVAIKRWLRKGPKPTGGKRVNFSRKDNAKRAKFLQFWYLPTPVSLTTA
jgi:hypothetical protein